MDGWKVPLGEPGGFLDIVRRCLRIGEEETEFLVQTRLIALHRHEIVAARLDDLPSGPFLAMHGVHRHHRAPQIEQRQ